MPKTPKTQEVFCDLSFSGYFTSVLETLLQLNSSSFVYFYNK